MQPLREDFVTSTKNFVCQVLFTPDADTTLMTRIAEDMASAPKDVALSAIANAWTYDMSEAMRTIRLPVRGINSDYYPVNIDAGRRHAQSFEIRFMTDVGHYLMLEDPETFNRLLEETVQEILQSSKPKETAS
jgi:pimeloyl-ACP methyl ester carboxylesterase